MNKKIMRIFLAVCLMLAMTSSTAFAKGAGVKNFTWYITKTDRVVHNASSTSSNAAITGKITIKRNDDPDGKPYIIEISDINIRGIKVNANEYNYGTEYWDDDDQDTIELSVARGCCKDIGYIRFHVTKDGRLLTTHHNYNF